MFIFFYIYIYKNTFVLNFREKILLSRHKNLPYILHYKKTRLGFLTAEIFSPHVPQGNVCGEMLLPSHITLTFPITPQNFGLMSKSYCLTALNGNDMKSKIQTDAMENSKCN